MYTITQLKEQFPPIICRLLARQGGRGWNATVMRDEELSALAGMRVKEIRRLSNSCSWDNVSVGKMLRFTQACGIDFDSPSNIEVQIKYIRKLSGRWFTSRNYLRRDPDWDRRWKPMIYRYIHHLSSQQPNLKED